MEEKNKDIEQREDIPQFVHRDGMLADKEYDECEVYEAMVFFLF